MNGNIRGLLCTMLVPPSPFDQVSTKQGYDKICFDVCSQ